MRNSASFFERTLTTGNTLEQPHAPLQRLVGFNIDKVGARHAMLRNQDRLAIALNLRQ